MIFLLASILLLYSLLLVIGSFGWRLSIKDSSRRFETLATVVVPVRNESVHIPALIESLSAQEGVRYEVVLVNDHSSDDSLHQLRQSIGDNPLFRIINLPEGQAGKKVALQAGISEAKGNVIVTTDADTIHPSRWLQTLLAPLGNEKIQMVAGPVALMNDGSWLGRLQSVEWVSVQSVTAATFNMSVPFMLNGANLAFRRVAFNKVGGYNDTLQWSSGDDEFMMKKIIAEYGTSAISFVQDTNSIVRTYAMPDWPSLLSQRRRWAGKWKANKDSVARFLAPLTVAAHIAFVTLLVVHSPGALLLAAMKMSAEWVFLRPASQWLYRKFDWPGWVLLQFLYPVYALSVAMSLLTSAEWKGRALSEG